MEGTKPRTASSIGMFDLLKGIGMLTIVLAHTAELYPLSTEGIASFAYVLFAYREALMGAFFIASGYGFRKRSIHKCISQQVNTLLKPYLYTAAATTVLHCIVHKAAFGAWDAAVSESVKVLGGFLLGLPHTTTYFGFTFFSCGPMWYLISLMLAWVLLDVLLDVFPERYIPWAVAGVTLLGWGITLVWEAPFCIAQGMVSLPYLYMGYLAKKRRLFETPLSGRAKLIIAAAMLGILAGALVTRSTDCVSMGEWTMGPLSILLDGIAGYGILRIFMAWQRRADGPIVHALEGIGRRSLFIFCIHTVELTAIPWYLMAANYTQHPLQGILLQFAVSMLSILVITELLVRRRDFARVLHSNGSGDKPRRRQKNRHYAAKH